jgi:hypothetical protein
MIIQNCAGNKHKSYGIIRMNMFEKYVVQGEARHRKYKRVTLGGGQAYDR